MADPADDPADAVTAALWVATFAVIVDPPSATAHLARARQIAAPLANPALDTHIAHTSGWVERGAGHYDVALAHFRKAMELAVRSGNPLYEGLTLFSLGVLAAMTDSDDTDRSVHDALTQMLATRNWVLVWTVIEALALYWARARRDGPAAVLLGHLEAHNIRYAYFVEQRREAVAALGARGDAEDRLAQGAALERDQLVAYALAQLADTQH
jgi:hypothetical protein